MANGKEMARRNGELEPGITAFADGMSMYNCPSRAIFLRIWQVHWK